MKLLLTSAGITNQLIADELKTLVGKDSSHTRVGFIPTAANMESGNKDWYIAQLTNLHAHGFDWIDIIELADAAVDWRERLREVDVVFVSGGNTFHLLDQYRKNGFDQWLKNELGERVYVGVSAGSIVATPTIAVADIPPKDRNYANLRDLTGVGLVDFEIEPHCDKQRFETMKSYSETTAYPLYAIDDQSAVLVYGGHERVISQGEWHRYQ